MFKLSTNVESLHRVVAMLVAVAVLVWSLGVYSNAQAANLTEISNTLTDSNVSVTSGHTIEFTIPTGSSLASGDVISVTFPAGFTGVGSLVTGDIVAAVGGVPFVKGAYATTSSSVSFDGATAAAGNVITITIADSIVTNPTAGSYEFLVTAGATDTGRTRVAILDPVTVTASVNTSFEFAVTGLATSTALNGTSTTGSSTATEIPFGVLTPGEIKTMGQELSVITNAFNGFVVTVEQDGNLQSSTGADIDGFTNGTYVDTPEAWPALAPNIALENTWGHWGVTSDDATLDSILGGGDFTAGTLFVAASTTPRAIFAHDGPSDGSTQNVGLVKVGYQVEISSLQEAGDDYTTTLTYIATPTF